jgi:hypothetical protein
LLTVRARFFKGANIDGLVQDEEMVRTFAVTVTPDQVRIGARNIDWTIQYDDVSIVTDAVGFVGPNVPPVVSDAGADQNVVPWNTVTLDGNGSDGAITTYTWVQSFGSPIVTLGGSGAVRTFTAPAVLGGTILEFELTVTDGATTDGDAVLIYVASGDEFYLNASNAWVPQLTDWL